WPVSPDAGTRRRWKLQHSRSQSDVRHVIKDTRKAPGDLGEGHHLEVHLSVIVPKKRQRDGGVEAVGRDRYWGRTGQCEVVEGACVPQDPRLRAVYLQDRKSV